jgi:hypothetical protein
MAERGPCLPAFRLMLSQNTVQCGVISALRESGLSGEKGSSSSPPPLISPSTESPHFWLYLTIKESAGTETEFWIQVQGWES